MEKPKAQHGTTMLKRGGSGALLGAQIGSAIPGVGTAIGAGIGFAAGSLLGAIESGRTFQDQMKMYRKNQKLQEQQEKIAEASMREHMRAQKSAEGRAGRQTSLPPVMDSTDRQILTLGSTGYDQFMANNYGYGA